MLGDTVTGVKAEAWCLRIHADASLSLLGDTGDYTRG